MSDRRLQDLIRFYSILNKLEKTIGARALADCRGRMKWPTRGVHFFREAGEDRSDTGDGLRVVRVGTHALKAGGSTTLWGRLSTHRGQVRSGGGNHRGSIFRLIVGTALKCPPRWLEHNKSSINVSLMCWMVWPIGCRGKPRIDTMVSESRLRI